MLEAGWWPLAHPSSDCLVPFPLWMVSVVYQHTLHWYTFPFPQAHMSLSELFWPCYSNCSLSSFLTSQSNCGHSRWVCTCSYPRSLLYPHTVGNQARCLECCAMRGFPCPSEPLRSSVRSQQQTHVNMSSCVSPLSFAVMNDHKLGRSNNRNLVFTVLEAESRRPGCQHGQVQVKALWLADSCFPALSQSGEKERK